MTGIKLHALLLHMKSKILITRGSGFLGTALLRSHRLSMLWLLAAHSQTGGNFHESR